MERVAVFTPAEYLARFAAAGGGPRGRRRRRAGSVRLRFAIGAGVGVVVTAATYGVSLAWVLWFVERSGGEWVAQLFGRIG